MRNLNRTRKLRGQTASGLRRRMRIYEDRIENLEAEKSALRGENFHLRRELRLASKRPIPIPKGFVDLVAEKYARALGQAMADKAIEQNPELGIFARTAGEWYERHVREGFDLRMNPSETFELMYEEMLDGKFKLSMYLDRVTLNYADDIRMVRMMRFVGPDAMPADMVIEDPRPHRITNAQISASCDF